MIFAQSYWLVRIYYFANCGLEHRYTSVTIITILRSLFCKQKIRVYVIEIIVHPVCMYQNVENIETVRSKTTCLFVGFSVENNLKIKIYKTIILPVVLYGCETWCLTLREERRLRVFENRILRRIFGPNGEWRRLHNEELHSLYCSPNIVSVIKSRRLRWAGHVARMEKGKSAFKILTGKPTGKRPLGEA